MHAELNDSVKGILGIINGARNDVVLCLRLAEIKETKRREKAEAGTVVENSDRERERKRGGRRLREQGRKERERGDKARENSSACRRERNNFPHKRTRVSLIITGRRPA